MGLFGDLVSLFGPHSAEFKALHPCPYPSQGPCSLDQRIHLSLPLQLPCSPASQVCVAQLHGAPVAITNMLTRLVKLGVAPICYNCTSRVLQRFMLFCRMLMSLELFQEIRLEISCRMPALLPKIEDSEAKASKIIFVADLRQT